jgi:hypothetical protein
VTITLTEKQANTLFKKLLLDWWNDECNTDLDDAMRALDNQLRALPTRPSPAHSHSGSDHA